MLFIASTPLPRPEAQVEHVFSLLIEQLSDTVTVRDEDGNSGVHASRRSIT